MTLARLVGQIIQPADIWRIIMNVVLVLLAIVIFILLAVACILLVAWSLSKALYKWVN